MCPKIVQKYVERSFLLDASGLPSLQREPEPASPLKVTKQKSNSPSKKRADRTDFRKFDLRQWVYVNSFDPLHAFIYKKAYLRICGAHFDLSQFDD